MDSTDDELDPRIQIELENLNTATNEINKLEIELEEANSTFRILLNESTRRLKLLSKKLGSCIEKARPYYDSLEKARIAQIECQAAAVKFQRANEIHAAAKETVALAEQRFMSNSHEWQFDNAWQEMLNHATIKVMDAEKQKAESGAEHHNKAIIFNAAELKVQQLEERFRRSIQKARPYFDEKQICQDQLETQKERIQQLQQQLQQSKQTYSKSFKNLEMISEEIHKQRGTLAPPPGVREPGVGCSAAGNNDTSESNGLNNQNNMKLLKAAAAASSPISNQIPDYNYELDKCELQSVGSSAVSEKDPTEDDYDESLCDGFKSSNSTLSPTATDLDLEILKQKMKTLAVRPVEGGDGKSQQQQNLWESELNATVDKLDNLMMLRESCSASSSPTISTAHKNISLPVTPTKKSASSLSPLPPIKMLKKDPLPLLANVSMHTLPSIKKTIIPSIGIETNTVIAGAMQKTIGCNNTTGLTSAAAQYCDDSNIIVQNKRKLSLQ